MSEASTSIHRLLTPAQQHLIERSLPLVRRRAQHWAKRYDGLLTRDDAESAGRLGLMEAVHRYDPRRDDVLEGFILRWVDGRILDLIQDESAARRLTRALYCAAGALGSTYPCDYDIMNEDEASLLERLSRFAQDLAVVAFLGGVASDTQDLATPSGSGREPTEASVVEAMTALEAALTVLDREERGVVRALYVDGTSMEEAAAALGLTFKQVRLRKGRALKKLRAALERSGVRVAPPPVDVLGARPALAGLTSAPDPDDRAAARRQARPASTAGTASVERTERTEHTERRPKRGAGR
ncbi:sigma-70 family RNA polymerase sigma factor [Chondromyces crocatus]|uniref:Uncharacterized protein n=1 Tax=Chondromyces crocatus TaxID=52 RepID=A0A0K1EB16_CHOCO|nr:sigma-70 family RNA polymerase sigma factor [Chondromyces crocatus]AKT37882.1 uncharacterized protein CMC5_020250 [Chondromyces crocatus]